MTFSVTTAAGTSACMGWRNNSHGLAVPGAHVCTSRGSLDRLAQEEAFASRLLQQLAVFMSQQKHRCCCNTYSLLGPVGTQAQARI